MPRFATCSPSRLNQTGVTLVELMITLVVLAIILAIAIPSFENTIASSRLAGVTNDLNGSLALARSEAIRRGQRVTVCNSNNGLQCAAAGNWGNGWIVFVDTTRAGNGASVDNANETIIRTASAAPAGIVVNGNANVTQYVSFSPDGQARLMNGVAQSGILRVCSTSTSLGNDQRARNLSLSVAGLVAMETVNGVANGCPAP